MKALQFGKEKQEKKRESEREIAKFVWIFDTESKLLQYCSPEQRREFERKKKKRVSVRRMSQNKFSTKNVHRNQNTYNPKTTEQKHVYIRSIKEGGAKFS